jgi:1-pyrroline-5-carboxylate dehydrogenase
MFEPPAELHERFASAMERMRARLGVQHRLYLAGEDRKADRYFVKTNPANTTQVLGEFPAANPADADAAMRAAASAWPGWRRTPIAERGRLLRRVAQLIEDRVYDIAAALTLEVGKNRMEALGEAQECADFFTLYSEDFERHGGFNRPLPDDPLISHVSHNRSVLKSYGPWVVIAPFNFPLALAGGPSAAALITGNTVVVKGASATPWADRLLADCVRDAGLPSGVFNYLSGPGTVTGATLIAHPLTAGVTFTGSHNVGMHIVQTMQAPPFPRPCIAEMGGKNACIVTAAADLERAATGIVRSAYGMSGQKCSALSRMYVHERIADTLLDKLLEKIGAISIGDPAQREHWMGPVTTQNAYENYARYSDELRAGGSRIFSGGEQLREGTLGGGFFVRPTLAEAPLEHRLWDEEMFLPILMMHRVSTNEAAMELANRSPLGLTAGFYGSVDEIAWFNEHIEAGVTYANRPQGATTGAWPGYQAFGGWKGSGSTGKAIGSFYYLPLYMREQSQTIVE